MIRRFLLGNRAPEVEPEPLPDFPLMDRDRQRPSGIGHSAFGHDIQPLDDVPMYPYLVDDGRPRDSS